MIVLRTMLFDHLINKSLANPYVGVPNTLPDLAFMASST